MRIVKRFLMQAVLLAIFMTGILLLLIQFSMYRQAYRNLSNLISHSSIQQQAVEGGE